MAQAEIEYFYSSHSAYAYLGSRKLAAICARFNCRLIHRPFNLSPVVEHAGGASFAERTQAHVDYFFGRDIERWAAFRGVDILSHRPSFHDAPLHLSSGMLIAADQAGLDIDRLTHAVLEAHWRDDIDLSDAKALSRTAAHIGLDPSPLLEAARSEDVQAVFEKNTKDAMEMNLFGSPTYVLNGDPYYGQDHLELLEHALTNPFPANTFSNPQVGS